MSVHGSSHRQESLGALGAAGLVVVLGLMGLWAQPKLAWQDDMLTQYLPASREVARAFADGEWAILTDLCWHGAALAGEYQHAVFSIVEVPLVSLVWSLGLSPSKVAAALVLFYLGILAAGVHRLARSRGIGALHAHLAVLVTCFNGWMVTWAAVTWYPALRSFAWIPWAWWALERAIARRADRPWSFIPAGAFVYLVFSAGWPFTCAMLFLLCTFLAVRGWCARDGLASAWPIVAAGVMGTGLAAPALLTLAEYVASSPRAHGEPLFHKTMVVPLEGLLGIALPTYTTWWHNFFEWKPRVSVELAGALVPLVVLVTAVLVRGRSFVRDRRADLLFAAVPLLLATSPSFGSFRFSYRWLPLVHLTLGLLGAHALASLEARDDETLRRRPLLPPALAATLIGWAWLRATLTDFQEGAAGRRLGWQLLALAAAWLVLAWIAERTRRSATVPALAFVLGSLALTYVARPPNAEVPAWELARSPTQTGPLDPKRRYLSIFTWFDLMKERTPLDGTRRFAMEAGGLRPAYTGLYAGIPVLHGYSSVGQPGLNRLFEFGIQGSLSDHAAVRILRESAENTALLEMLGVDGLLVHERYGAEIAALTARNFVEAARVPNGVVLHRRGRPSAHVRSIDEATTYPSTSDALDRLSLRAPGEFPVALVASATRSVGPEHFARADVQLVREERRRSTVSVSVPAGGRPALVVFARPWLPGWRARLNGENLAAEPVTMLMPGVVVPPGAHGELVLEYAPAALSRGFLIAGATLALSSLAFGVLMWRRRRAGT